MDLNMIRESIITKVYHITAGQVVPLHRHGNKDEIFYCVGGSGFGVRPDGEEVLSAGKAFIVPAGSMHSLRTDGDLYVASFLVPVVDDQPSV